MIKYIDEFKRCLNLAEYPKEFEDLSSAKEDNYLKQHIKMFKQARFGVFACLIIPLLYLRPVTILLGILGVVLLTAHRRKLREGIEKHVGVKLIEKDKDKDKK